MCQLVGDLILEIKSFYFTKIKEEELAINCASVVDQPAGGVRTRLYSDALLQLANL